jgi:hypothetical protein
MLTKFTKNTKKIRETQKDRKKTKKDRKKTKKDRGRQKDRRKDKKQGAMQNNRRKQGNGKKANETGKIQRRTINIVLVTNMVLILNYKNNDSYSRETKRQLTLVTST